MQFNLDNMDWKISVFGMITMIIIAGIWNIDKVFDVATKVVDVIKNRKRTKASVIITNRSRFASFITISWLLMSIYSVWFISYNFKFITIMKSYSIGEAVSYASTLLSFHVCVIVITIYHFLFRR